jgi:hypothetical protein
VGDRSRGWRGTTRFLEATSSRCVPLPAPPLRTLRRLAGRWRRSTRVGSPALASLSPCRFACAAAAVRWRADQPDQPSEPRVLSRGGWGWTGWTADASAGHGQRAHAPQELQHAAAQAGACAVWIHSLDAPPSPAAARSASTTKKTQSRLRLRERVIARRLLTARTPSSVHAPSLRIRSARCHGCCTHSLTGRLLEVPSSLSNQHASVVSAPCGTSPPPLSSSY